MTPWGDTFGGLPYQWVFAVLAGLSCPLLVVALGSLDRALLALLILGLSMEVDVNPGFCDKYAVTEPGVPITLISLVLLGLYGSWLAKASRGLRSIRLFPWVTIPFAVLVLWSGLSFMVSARPSYVLSEFPRAVEALLVFFYAANAVRSEDDAVFVTSCMAVAVGVTAAVGIAQYLAGSSFDLHVLGGMQVQEEQQYHGTTITRVSGLLSHPNGLAHFLCGWLPALLTCGIDGGGSRSRRWWRLSFVLGCAALVLTYSRGGWLAAVVSAFVLFALSWGRPSGERRKAAALRVLGLGSAVALLILPSVPNVVTRLSEDDSGAAYSRVAMAHTALKIVRDNWLTGVGLGNYTVAVWEYDSSPPVDSKGAAYPVHNMYLCTAAQLGVPALGLFGWISVVFVAAGIRAGRMAKGIRGLLALGLLAGLAGQYVHGMFDLVTLGHRGFVPLMFSGGLLVALARGAGETVSRREQRRGSALEQSR